MADRTAAADRLAVAVRNGERICVFGDYDADGITSTALLTDALRRLGGEVVPLLANRFAGGYGLSDAARLRVLEARPSVLVTCDCGTSDHPRIAALRARGIDVIVIDHHRVPEEALPAFAFLNPHRAACGFPYKGLASVGLTLSLVAAIRTSLGVKLDMRSFLDLVALGTIADVAPLDGDNRALVRAGLVALSGVEGGGTGDVRPGLRALAQVAGCTGRPGAAVRLTGEDVAFRLAPRINAPGRLGAPDPALSLLLASDPDEAFRWAQVLHDTCEQRKGIDRAIVDEVLLLLEEPATADLPVVVLGQQGWHPGVVGIVAGRVANRTGKPTVIIGFDGDVGRGSVRGPPGFPLFDALSDCADVLVVFGGHQAAAGVEVMRSKLDAFRARFADACRRRGAHGRGAPSVVRADAVFDAADDPFRVAVELEQFEPCGQSNPAPLLAFDDVRVGASRVMRGGHLRLDLELGGTGSLGAFGYELGQKDVPRTGERIRALGRLRRDTYRGGATAELRIERIERAGGTAADGAAAADAAADGPAAHAAASGTLSA
jgi:single-stranded-DNA-specific exonuclease